jgi:co-chaperonin GroES (HSP10)
MNSSETILEKQLSEASKRQNEKGSSISPALAGPEVRRPWRSSLLRRLHLLLHPVKNESGLVPAGHAMLLVPYEPDFDAAKRWGFVVPDTLRNNSIMVEMRATVIAMGDECYQRDGQNFFARLFTPWRPRCLPGDRIMINKYSGAVVVSPLNGQQYRMVNDEDVFVRITQEAERPEYTH